VTAIAVACCLALAAALAVGAHGPPRRRPPQPAPATDEGWMLRRRPLWAGLAGLAAATVLSAPLAWVAGPVVAAGTWVVIGRAESPASRRAREETRRDLPHVVGLLADALRTGQSPAAALGLVTEALPGPASERLSAVVARLRMGLDPGSVWADLADDAALAPLGRALSRAHGTGASVVASIEQLADSLAEDRRGAVEDRARAVGVKAALPLGLCLLPSFVLLGIVPVVAGMLGTLGL
jgi:Flp pilus assembly protein TadB